MSERDGDDTPAPDADPAPAPAPASASEGGEASGGEGEDATAGQPLGPAKPEVAAQAITGAITPATSVRERDDGAVVREASFADVATRPQREAITHADAVNDVAFYRKLVRLDGDLAGTIRAKSQVGAMGAEVTHPAMRGHEDELSDLERDIMDACGDLLTRLGLDREMKSFFRRLIIHGNDVSHIEYEDGVGVTDVTELPLQALTITDTKPDTGVDEADRKFGPLDDSTGVTDMDKTIHEGNWYTINEDLDSQQAYPARDILHMAINKRGNWYTDRENRDTYSVWGERRLAPIKFALQAKQKTLSNKVALDDSLLAREVYHIDVETLFGHIQNDSERTERAREYKEDLKSKLNNLAPDEKPILPEEVSVTVEGPDGSTADNQTEFIEMMNNTIQHALTFHSASFGRDAGGSLAGNQPAKEMSDTGVKALRSVVKAEFRELFRVHALLAFPEARGSSTGPDGPRRANAAGPEDYVLADDVTLPTLSFDPVSRRDKSDRVKDAAAAYEKGVADLNEARAWIDLDPIKDEDVEEMFFRRDPREMDTGDEPGAGDGDGGVGREQDESEEDQGQGPGQGQQPNDDGAGEAAATEAGNGGA